MIKHRTFFAAAVLSVLCIAVISGCNKDGVKLPLEPISIVKPTGGIGNQFAGDTVPIEIAITTDRPINWVLCVYDIDDSSTHTVPYVPSFPDTLFFTSLQNISPRVNLYTATQTYHIPDTLVQFSTVKFKVSFQAGAATATYGQNYPIGVVSAQKDFILHVNQ